MVQPSGVEPVDAAGLLGPVVGEEEGRLPLGRIVAGLGWTPMEEEVAKQAAGERIELAKREMALQVYTLKRVEAVKQEAAKRLEVSRRQAANRVKATLRVEAAKREMARAHSQGAGRRRATLLAKLVD